MRFILPFVDGTIRVFDAVGRSARREMLCHFLLTVYVIYVLLQDYYIFPFIENAAPLEQAGLVDAYFRSLENAPPRTLMTSVFVVVTWPMLIIRRLHDISLPGFWVIAFIAPGLNVIAFVALLVIPGTRGHSSYGDDPRQTRYGNIKSSDALYAQRREQFVEENRAFLRGPKR